MFFYMYENNSKKILLKIFILKFILKIFLKYNSTKSLIAVIE